MKKVILSLILILSLFCGCSHERKTLRTFSLDTEISITVDKKDEKKAANALALCRKYEKKFSRTDKESELYKLNNSASSPKGELLSLIEKSVSFSKASDGAFDITVAPLCDLWDIKSRTVPPTQKEIDEALKNVGYEKLTLSPFDSGGRTIDLGAVAKGYIADRLGEYLREKNVQDAIIDLGGNILLIGEFTVGVRNPFKPDELFAKITLKDKSAVTSGAYQRYFEYEGKRYHHIIDPRSGQSAQSGLASVTVISSSSETADALSTAIYVLGEEGISLCEKYENTDAFLITDDGEVVTTDGFSEKYKLELF